MAVAAELQASGAEVSFLGTRERIEAELVPAAGYEIDFVKVRGIDRGNPLRAARAGVEALAAVGSARVALRRRGAEVVLGGGGFVAGPAGLAATLTGTPLVLTEADSHLGLANRLLAGRARRVCLAFPIDGREGDRYLLTGRPVPAAVLTADRDAARARFGLAAAERCLLVVGGSQGARVMSDIVPGAIERLEPALWNRLVLVQQVREEDMARVRAVYDRLKIDAELAPFLSDLPVRLASSHLIISRSGAGTVAELGAVGRPSILVPLPGSIDQDQFANAGVLAQAEGAIRIAQADFTPDRLAAEISAIAAEPARLTAMAAGARTVGKLDAAERLADLVAKVAGI
jgi:UDP-N-acetylglucosamine--N-acetylmuramyl-(pentapeptide) pyrophosphoryl-undecaprenol N-acetylglucosamine transferase